MNQDRSQNEGIAQLRADVTLLARSIANMRRLPGHHARWGTGEYEALDELLDRLDPLPEPERDDEPYVEPTDWAEADEPHDDLSTPARPA